MVVASIVLVQVTAASASGTTDEGSFAAAGQTSD
jgi:hypothetical protein